jgi:hypothetical protein
MESQYSISPAGSVEFDVPAIHGSCDEYLFGIIKVKDGSPERERVIRLVAGQRIVRVLSLWEVGRLPLDKSC